MSTFTINGQAGSFPLGGNAAPPSQWTLDQGVDIAAPAHTPLLAIGSGTIVGRGINGFGPWAPVLKLDSGGYVYYGHAGPAHQLPIGTHVSAGDVIGEVGAGQVGISTGPHLEIGFATNSAGQPVGPNSAARMRQLLLGSELPSKVPGEDTGVASGIFSLPTKAAGAVADAAAGVAENAALHTAEAVIGSDSFRKAGLYVVLVLGGLGLLVTGVSRAAGVKAPNPLRHVPVPVPV